MDEARKFEITVLGETIRLNSDENIDYMNAVIQHVSDLVEKVDSMDRSGMSKGGKLLFALVLMTDEMLKTKDEATKLSEKLNFSESAFAKVQKELSDFINLFEGSNGAANA